MERCERCGGLLAPGSAWCGQCYWPVGGDDRSRISTRAPWAGPLKRGADIDPDPVPVATYSRWRKGPTTFGPSTKIAITAGMALIGFVDWYMFRFVDGPMVMADVGIYAAGAIYVLRHVWKRERIG